MVSGRMNIDLAVFFAFIAIWAAGIVLLALHVVFILGLVLFCVGAGGVLWFIWLLNRAIRRLK